MSNLGKIDGIEFHELDAERYWSFPASYKKDKKAETRNMILSGDYLGARKMDGAYYRFVKDMDGVMSLQGRSRGVSGEFLNKIGHVPHLQPFFDSLPNGTCLLGELYFPENEGSNQVTKIMGCKEDKAIERQKQGKKLHYYVFDIWAYDGESFLNMSALDRFYSLCALLKAKECIEIAKYSWGEKLWDEYQRILSIGGEGIVITKASSTPEPGKRTSRKTLKLKKELVDTIDCVVMGANPPTKEYTGKNIEEWTYWADAVTEEKLPVERHYREFMNGVGIIPVTKNWYMGMAGSLRLGLVDGGKVVYFGDVSGLTYEILSDWGSYVGKVCEVSAMEITDDFKLRHPKFIQFREDKNIKECTKEQVIKN